MDDATVFAQLANQLAAADALANLFKPSCIISTWKLPPGGPDRDGNSVSKTRQFSAAAECDKGHMYVVSPLLASLSTGRKPFSVSPW